MRVCACASVRVKRGVSGGRKCATGGGEKGGELGSTGRMTEEGRAVVWVTTGGWVRWEKWNNSESSTLYGRTGEQKNANVNMVRKKKCLVGKVEMMDHILMKVLYGKALKKQKRSKEAVKHSVKMSGK